MCVHSIYQYIIVYSHELHSFSNVNIHQIKFGIAACKKGHFGINCDPCPPGFFGYGCGGRCFPLCANEDCDRFNGCIINAEKTTQELSSFKGAVDI